MDMFILDMSPFTFFTSSLSSCFSSHCILDSFFKSKNLGCQEYYRCSSFSHLIAPFTWFSPCPRPSPAWILFWSLPLNVIPFSLANLWLWMKYSSCCDFSIQQPKSIWCCCGNAYRLFPVAVPTCPRHHHLCQDTYSPLSSCPNIPYREQEETHFPQLSEG